MPIRIPTGPDCEIRIEAVGEKLHVGLWRRSDLPDGAFVKTDASFLVAPHLAPLVAEGLVRAARRMTRNAQAQLWARPEGEVTP